MRKLGPFSIWELEFQSESPDSLDEIAIAGAPGFLVGEVGGVRVLGHLTQSPLPVFGLGVVWVMCFHFTA